MTKGRPWSLTSSSDLEPQAKPDQGQFLYMVVGVQALPNDVAGLICDRMVAGGNFLEFFVSPRSHRVKCVMVLGASSDLTAEGAGEIRSKNNI